VRRPRPKAGPESSLATTKGPIAGVRERQAVHQALAEQIVSVAQLVGRPIRDPSHVVVSRVRDVVARWESGPKHPPVTGIVADALLGRVFIPAQDLVLRQSGVQVQSANVVVGSPVQADGDVVLARDVLDRQLVDVGGVQVVRAADVYLFENGNGWELAGIDVGLWALLRRILPRRVLRPTPDRFIDWADLQAFVPCFDETSEIDPAHPAASAGMTGSSVQLASPAANLHKLRAKDVAALLTDLGRSQQAQLAALSEPSVAAQVLRGLDPSRLQALLDELDTTDRDRLQALLSEEATS
jgi:hypothetical protein